jgi:hypothetical protein
MFIAWREGSSRSKGYSVTKPYIIWRAFEVTQ